MGGWMGRWMDGRMGGWMEGWVDGWKDGWVDGWILKQSNNNTITTGGIHGTLIACWTAGQQVELSILH